MKAKIAFKVLGSLVISTLLFAFLMSQVSAVSISPANLDLTGQPGDVIRGVINVSNSETEPRILNVGAQDFIINPESNAKQFIQDSAPRGMKDWITLDKESQRADPGEEFGFSYTISIPEDAAPGTYTSSILAGTSPPDSDGTRVGIASRVASIITLTIEGDYTEEISLESFNINKQKFLKGNIVFDVTVKNLGDVLIAPFGQITIYDADGELIEGVHAITNEFDGKTVVVNRENEIPVNKGRQSVLPGAQRTLDIAWTNRNIEAGEYQAKLKLYYGEDNALLEAETDFEIKENFYIGELSAESYFKTSLPMSFSAKLNNTGNLPLEPTGYFEISNIFGSQKKRVDFAPEELAIAGGEEKVLDNIAWDSGFALGFYKASLTIDVGGKVYSESTAFWIISWWQALIVIVVILLVILALYKGVHGYAVMKKKLKEAGKEKSA